MDDSKSEQESAPNQKHNRLVKVIKKLKKKGKRKAKKKVLNGTKEGNRLADSRQCYKSIKNKQLTVGRIKARQTHEGMFLKGLRTQYVSRELLNEANEARKNGDINKIIDIGRIVARKGTDAQRKFILDTNSDKDNKETMSISKTDYQGTVNKSPERKVNEKNKIDFDVELEKFSSQYEEKVTSEIIPLLPEDGIVETATESLHVHQKHWEDELQKQKTQELPFITENTFVARNSDSQTSLQQEINEYFFSYKESSTSQQIISDFHDTLSEKSMENITSLQLRGNIVRSCEKYSLYQSNFEYTNVQSINSEFQFEHLKKLFLKSSCDTPTAQFYRRNMF